MYFLPFIYAIFHVDIFLQIFLLLVVVLYDSDCILFLFYSILIVIISQIMFFSI